MKTPFERIPWTILCCVGGLTALGLSAIARGDELAGGQPLSGRQVLWVLLAGPAALVMAVIPYRRWRIWSYPLLGLSLILLGLVYLMPARNGAHRWIPLGAMDFQPSEMAKIAFILAMAHYLMFGRNYRTLRGLLTPFLITLLPIGLILREPDLGTSLLFLPTLFAMLLAAGARPRHLALVGLLGVAVLPALWTGMSSEQKSRVVSLVVQRDSGPAPKGDGYHLYQSKQVLALGGLWGSAVSGMPLDDPVAYHLPAARTDFVFCLVGERWGLAGCGLTLLLYAVFFARGLMVAAGTREPFGRLIAVGVVSLLASQTVINTAMTVGLMPITGMTLPLMSYGGSSLLSTAVAIGLLINVASRSNYEVTPDPLVFDSQRLA